MTGKRSTPPAASGPCRLGRSTAGTTRSRVVALALCGLLWLLPAATDIATAQPGGDVTAPTITSHSPADGATGVVPELNVTATFSEPVDSSSVVFELRDAGNNPVAALVTYDDLTRTARLDPAAGLQVDSSYTATVSGATDLAGNPMAGPTSWSFTTADVGFHEDVAIAGLVEPTVVAFSPDGRVFVAEKSGLIQVFDDLQDTTPTMFADLRTNVYNFWDRGLFGMALDPDFPTTPYVYVLYTHDAPIGGTAPQWGNPDTTDDPCPSPPGPVSDGCVASGRLSRLEAAGDVMVGPEVVLIEDWFQQFPSHTLGTLAFGPDGALYASAGESAAWDFADYGQEGAPTNPGGDPPVGVGGIQTPPTAEGGSLRSQDLETPADPTTLDGTIIRVDPDTGAGLSDNPLFGSPDLNARRVIAYGLRSPFRFTIRAGTGEIFIGDVGWLGWDEINRIPDPADAIVENFGWPCFEGNAPQGLFDGLNLDLCESLYARPNDVTMPFFSYPVSGDVIAGDGCSTTGLSSPTGLAFYPGGTYPPRYQGALFFADHSRKCIWAMFEDESGEPDPATREIFITGAANPIQLVIGPDGDLFYVDFNGGSIRRIRYVGGNQAPVITLQADPPTGETPLTVRFDGRGSTSPQGDVLTFAWDLDDDGLFDDATGAQPSRTYTQPGTVIVRVLVTDEHGLSGVSAVEVTNLAPTMTALSASTNLSVAGEVVVFTATVTPEIPAHGVPTGSVTFMDGATILAADVPLDAGGQASLATGGLAVGIHTLGAAYGGDGTRAASLGTIDHTVTTAVTLTFDDHADNASLAHTSPFFALSGTASTTADPGGARAESRAPSLTAVTWVNDRGGNGTAEGTSTWIARYIPLVAGINTLTVTATDDTGTSVAKTLTVTVARFDYYLAEGATGPFFDFDVALGNPNPTPAPVTLTFLREDGTTTVHQTTVAAMSRLTVRVNDLPGLATAPVSTVVSSDAALPLSVERSMMWDASAPAPSVPRLPPGLVLPAIAPGASHYGGHTAQAVDAPRTTWLFAEGSQGFFDTYLLLANPNATATAATVTYLLEGAAPVIQQVTVGPTARLTLFAGAVPALVGASFGISVTAAQPIIAERAMYFSTDTFWDGGHESAGVPEASTRWFHAEGATGTLFDTFLLVSNPNPVTAHLNVTYLLETGATVVKTYGVAATGRITINVATQDPRLASAAFSTTVSSNVPVISERATYWPTGFASWYAGHNAFGVTATGTTWGLAEGRVGSSVGYETYILLANPAATAATVRVTYLRTSGTPVVKTYTVAPTSRFNVYVNGMVPELVDESFAALIETTDGNAIAVERALYWQHGGQLWGGGTSATAVRLP